MKRPEDEKKYYGWSGTYSLPRTLWLTKEGPSGSGLLRNWNVFD